MLSRYKSKKTTASFEKLPKHVAIIMDGNGRWANARGWSRIKGHREGAKRVDEIVTECTRLGIEYLTLYTFSTENWNRPKTEVSLLMRLLIENLKSMDKKLIKNKVALTAAGTLETLPASVIKELYRVMDQTSRYEPKMQLSLALSYGGRREIVDCARAWVEKIQNGEEKLSDLTESTFSKFLYQPHFPDPDLLIRTGGDSRVSNFLLWSIAYSEFLVVPESWPEFRVENLHKALGVYGTKERRFGKTSKQVQLEAKAPIQ